MLPEGFKTENVQSLASVLGGTIYIHALTQSEVLFLTLFFKNNFIYLWPRWVFVPAQVFSSCSEPGATLVVVRGLLLAMASFVVEHWL